eukprot:605724-Pelagomonas_calceolata.AAC.6
MQTAMRTCTPVARDRRRRVQAPRRMVDKPTRPSWVLAPLRLRDRFAALYPTLWGAQHLDGQRVQANPVDA